MGKVKPLCSNGDGKQAVKEGLCWKCLSARDGKPPYNKETTKRREARIEDTVFGKYFTGYRVGVLKANKITVASELGVSKDVIYQLEHHGRYTPTLLTKIIDKWGLEALPDHLEAKLYLSNSTNIAQRPVPQNKKAETVAAILDSVDAGKRRVEHPSPMAEETEKAILPGEIIRVSPGPLYGDVMYLDFSRHPEILEKLRDQAEDQFRNPDQHALWLIKHSLK